MKKIIEITGLMPKPTGNGIIMTLKNEAGAFEQADLGMSQFDLMTMIGIKNLYEAIGRKFEMELDDKSQIIGLRPVDTRSYGFSDFERMEKTIKELLAAVQKMIAKDNKPPDPK